MRSIKLYMSMLFVLSILGGLQAQQSLHHATGGDASGSGGTVSYTVGHPVYTTVIGANGTVAQGVQHAFEILVTTGLEETNISLELDVFPNPTNGLLNLRIMDNQIQGLVYQLFDVSGRLIETKQLTDSVTKISMEMLPPATYYLHVTDHKQTMKSFKIIKH
ncbi:MAG: T9SS type A sorting domain-containing protein [Saprospiraceae bacterium]|nr:T9SS type A sorting domain-containing protein [Saprospiraceae bacterium]MCB9325394.1 T9SS type A sorting domain-containing protein [Lewinellaceae bacterium]